MSEPKRIAVYCEGPDDRAVLDGLAAAGLLPARFERATPCGGKSQLAARIEPFIVRVGGHAVALQDIDDTSTDQVGGDLEAGLRSSAPAVRWSRVVRERVTLLISTANDGLSGRLAVVPVGLPGEVVPGHPFSSFAVDDFLFELCRDAEIHARLGELSVPHDVAWKKLHEVVALFKSNGIPVTKSKRAMHLFRAIIDFRASNATFAQRLLEVARQVRGAAHVGEVFSRLRADLALAEQLLDSVHPEPSTAQPAP